MGDRRTIVQDQYVTPRRHTKAAWPETAPQSRPRKRGTLQIYREYNSTTSCSFTIGAISSREGTRVTLPWN
jgi:hypothetical protein